MNTSAQEPAGQTTCDLLMLTNPLVFTVRNGTQPQWTEPLSDPVHHGEAGSLQTFTSCLCFMECSTRCRCTPNMTRSIWLIFKIKQEMLAPMDVGVTTRVVIPRTTSQTVGVVESVTQKQGFTTSKLDGGHLRVHHSCWLRVGALFTFDGNVNAGNGCRRDP